MDDGEEMTEEKKEEKKEEKVIPSPATQEATTVPAAETIPTATAAPVAESKPKEEKKEEKVKPTNCVQCNKSIKKIRWYYRDGKYYCTKRCWMTASKKEAKPAEGQPPEQK